MIGTSLIVSILKHINEVDEVEREELEGGKIMRYKFLTSGFIPALQPLKTIKLFITRIPPKVPKIVEVKSLEKGLIGHRFLITVDVAKDSILPPGGIQEIIPSEKRE